MAGDGLSDTLLDAVYDAVIRIRAERRGMPCAELVGLSRMLARHGPFTMRVSASSERETVVVAVLDACPDAKLHFDGLTPRQQQVAGLLVRGCSNRQIAEALRISLATVKDHVHAVLRRTGSATRTVVAARGRRDDSNPAA